MQDADQNANEVVISGVGMVTAHGFGVEEHWNKLINATTRSGEQPADSLALRKFQPMPYLSDRRMLKAVSPVDAIGLVALEGIRKNLPTATENYDAARIGFYVGAPPSSSFDNEPYMEAMETSRGSDGRCSLRDFGKGCMTSRPTTLLVGLPNNVLCYGAMLLNAKGPNSNYTSGMLSGHLALINAARRLERNQLDFAVAGAFSAHSEPVHHSMFEHLGLARRVVSVDSTVTENSGERMTIADGSVFVALERRGDAVTHGRNSTLAYLGGAHMSDAQGPLAPDLDAPCIERAIFAAMEKAKVSASDVGLILTGAMGLKSIDSAELEGISRVFARVQAKPALGECCGFFGNLMEAGGLAELGLLPLLFKNQDLPSVLRSEAAQASGYATVIDTNKKTALVLRNSPWGEASCLVLRIGESIKIPLSN